MWTGNSTSTVTSFSTVCRRRTVMVCFAMAQASSGSGLAFSRATRSSALGITQSSAS